MAKKSFWGRLVEGFKAPNSSKGKQQKKKKRNETPRSERSINRSDVGRKSKGSSHTSNRNSNRETPRNERPVSRQVGSQQNKTRSTGTQRTTRSGAYRPNQVADLSERSVRMKSPTDRSGTGFKPKKHTKVENLTERATRKPTVNGKEVNTSINKAAAANKDFKRTAPKSIKKFSRGTSVAGDVVKYAGKDLVGTGLKMTAGVFDGPKKKQVANTNYKKFGDSLKNAGNLKSGGTKYKPTNTTGMGYKRDSKGNLVTDVQYGAKAKSFQNKLNKEANKWEESANKDVKDAVKGLSNKAKYDIPDLGPINKIMGMESAKDQRKRARDEINKTYSEEWKKQKTAIAKEFDDYVASQGLTADSMLNIDGKTMSVAEYRNKYLKDAYKETLQAMKTQKAKDIKDTSNIGKISARDIGEMGIKGGVEMAEMLIPYGGSAKASLKAADLLMGAGKAAKAGSKAAKGAKVLTSIEKEGARALSADGKAFVRKAFKEGFANGKKTADIVDDITKQVVRSDLKQNIKREIIANALQDASIGTTIDVTSAKKQGLEGKDFAKYMAQSAAMNAVMGAPIAGIAGRTGKAGKAAIKSDIVRNVNDEFVSIGKLAPEKSRELFNLIQRQDNGVKLTTDEAKRLKTLQNEQITNRSGVVQMDAKGNIVVNDANVVKSIFSEPELKEYTKLRAREGAGLPISKSDAVRMQEIDGKIKYAYQAVEHNANNVIKLGEKNLSKIGRSNLESAVEYFKKTGETTKLNKAMKMLDKDIKIATERNEALTKAINTMTDRTGINYRLVSNDEMGKLVGGQASTEGYMIRGEYRTVNKETGEVEIVINKDASQAHQTIIGHETGHLIKDNNEEEFLKLGDMLRDYAKKQDAKGLESFEKMMRESYPDLNDVDFNEEITCELLGRTIFGEDDAFIKRLAGENPTLLRRIVEYVKNLGQRIKHPELNAQLKAMTDKAEELIGEVKVEDVKKNAEIGKSKQSKIGPNAKGVDTKAADLAVSLKKDGTPNAIIKKLTGWVVGQDGKPRFEISDKDFKIKGDVLTDYTTPLSQNAEKALQKQSDMLLEEVQGILQKENANGYKQSHVISAINAGYDEKTLREILEYNAKRQHFSADISPELLDAFNKAHKITDQLIKGGPGDKTLRLGDLIEHDKLFEFYPDAKNIKVELVDNLRGAEGQFNPKRNSISISLAKYKEASASEKESVLHDLEDTLIHEIQHYIQKEEGFESGASSHFWETVSRNTNSEINNIYNELAQKGIFNVATSPRVAAQQIEGALGKSTADRYLNLVKVAEKLGYTVRGDDITAPFGISFENYKKTLGEVEARDTSANRHKTQEELDKNVPTYIDNEDVLIKEEFADADAKVKFSIEKIVKDENGNTHENVVRLDTDVFDGLKTRKEKESKLHDFVYEHFAGNKFKAYDDDGNPVTIEFAREGESHKKIGAKRKQKTLDEIADKPSHGMRRVKTQKAAAQADELIEVSKFDRTSDANVHGKLDKNGWEYRTLKVMDGDGGINDCVLSIAKTEDGRNILYDIKIKNKIGQAVEAAKSDSPVSPISKDRVSEPSSEVKEKFSKQKPNDTDRAAGRDIDELRRLDAEGKLDEAGKAKLDRLETRITEAEPPKKMPKRLAPKKEIPKAEAFRKAQEPKDKHSRERLDDYSESAINKFVAENEELAKGGKFTDSSGYKPPETESLPKSVVRNLRQDKSSKKEAREALVAHTVNPEKLTDERAEAFNKDFDRVSALIYNGDTGGARQVAEDIAREFGQVDDFELREIPDLWENIKTAQDIMRKTLLHMPQSDHSGRSGSFKDFKEALGEYDRHVLRVRKSTSGKEWSRGVDEVYEELSQELPDLFPRGVDSPDEQFKILAEVSKMNKKSASMSSVISEEEVESFYQEIARSIYDAAEKNASKFKDSSLKADIQQRKAKTPQGEQKKVIEPVKEKTVPDENPLTAKDVDNSEQAKMDGVPETKPKEKPVVNNTPVTDMTTDALEKELKRLNGAIKYGKTKEKIEIRKHRRDAVKEEIAKRNSESKPKYREVTDEMLTDKERKVFGTEKDYRPEGSATPSDAPARVEPDTAEPKTKVKPTDYDTTGPKTLDRSWLGEKATSVRRLLESSLVGFEQTANATGNKQLMQQVNNVIMHKNRISAWIEGSRAGIDREISGPGLNKIFSEADLFGKKNAAKRADFCNYLTYKHAIDRLDAGKPVHLDPETGKSIYTAEDYENFITKIEENYSEKELSAFEKNMRSYYNDLMKMRVETGLVSKEFADELANKYPHYVPTYRDGDEWLMGKTEGLSNKAVNVQQTVKTAKGGSEALEDLYQQTFNITGETIRNAEENKLMQVYADAMGITNKDLSESGATFKDVSDIAVSATGNTEDGWRVSFWQDGKLVTMPADKQIVKGLREFNAQDYRRMLRAASVMTGPMRAFKGLITDYNLIFGVRNGMRDFQQALVNSKDTGRFLRSIPSAWEAIGNKEKNAFFKLYEANGGKYAAFVYQDSKVVEPGSMTGLKKGVDATFGTALRKIEDINGAIELTPRLCEFIGTINKRADEMLKKEGSSVKALRQEIAETMYPGVKDLSGEQLAKVQNALDQRITKMVGKDVIDEAMRNSADITLNFSRNGVIGKALNMGVVPYFNPSIQGLSKMVRMFSESKADGTLLNFGMKLGVITLAPAAVNEILLADDENYQMLSTREKDSNYFIPLGDGKFIKLPKPRENAVLAEPVEYGLRFFFDHAQYGEVKKGEYLNKATWKQMFVSGWDNIGPASPFSDNIYSPILRLAQNKTWYGGSIESTAEVLQKKEGELKNSEISDETTSAIAKWIGETKVGGSTVSDITHMSPKKIDDFMDSYLGMIYDLGISQTSERSREEMSLKNNPITNQFIKDSVFSNKNGMELWSEFDKAMEPKTVKGKLVKGAKNKLLGNSAWNIDEKNDAANDWLNYKGYDDITYSSGVATVRGYDDLSKTKKENIIRRIKRAQNDFRRDLVYGEKKVTPEKDPIRTFADIFGVDKAMKDFTFTHTNKETGEKTNQHLDAWKEYKKTDTYKKSDSSGKNFLDFYCDMRYTNGEIGVSKSQPSWMTASILAANKKGNNDDLGLSYIKPSWDDDNRTSAKEILQRGKNLASADFGQKEHIREEKAIFTSGRKLGYDYRNELNPWDEAMSLATNKKYKFDDRNYYAADTSGKVSRRMNYARCLNEKGYSTKQIYDFAKEYDIKIPKTANMSKDQYVSTMKAFNAKVESAVRDKYGDKPLEEQAAIYHVITEDRYNKPFGDVGDYSMDSDTGITELDAKSSGGGYGYRRRRRRGYRRRHYGGHGGGGGGGSMPKTESGTYEGKITDAKVKKLTAKDLSLGHHFKAKVSNTSKTSNTSKPSNLNDAYRKRINKLMLENTKKLY